MAATPPQLRTYSVAMLDLGVDLDAWPWVWLVIAVIFALIEITILGGSFILLPFAASAFIASILGFYDVAIEIQWAVFLFGGGVLWFGFYRWAKTFLRDHELPPGVGADRLVGMAGVVTVDIALDDTDRRGRVSVAGETWSAIAPQGELVPVGTRIRVTSVQGTRVFVEPISSDESDGREDLP